MSCDHYRHALVWIFLSHSKLHVTMLEWQNCMCNMFAICFVLFSLVYNLTAFIFSVKDWGKESLHKGVRECFGKKRVSTPLMILTSAECYVQ